MTQIRTPVEMHLLSPETWTAVNAVLIYNATDPFAVTLRFVPHPEWRCARDLLRTGLGRPTGAGDVRFWPARSGDAMFLQLQSPAGRAVFELSKQTVRCFLDASERVVATGSEAMPMDDTQLFPNEGAA